MYKCVHTRRTRDMGWQAYRQTVVMYCHRRNEGEVHDCILVMLFCVGNDRCESCLASRACRGRHRYQQGQTDPHLEYSCHPFERSARTGHATRCGLSAIHRTASAEGNDGLRLTLHIEGSRLLNIGYGWVGYGVGIYSILDSC